MDTLGQVRPGGRTRCRVAPAALALLRSARQGLAGAAEEGGAGSRYVAAHLAALRAAAAVVAARPEVGTGPRRKAPNSRIARPKKSTSSRRKWPSAGPARSTKSFSPKRAFDEAPTASATITATGTTASELSSLVF